MTARAVALWNDKGSTGKTTLALACAAAAARAGAGVLLLDADRAGDAVAVAGDWSGVRAQVWTPDWVAEPTDDLVLIDCRASDDAPEALERAELVVVPVEPEPLSVRRLAALIPSLNKPFAVVVNGYYHGADTEKTMKQLTEMLGEFLWKPPIPRRTAFPRAQADRLPVQEFRGRPVEVVEATATLAARMLTWAPTS